MCNFSKSFHAFSISKIGTDAHANSGICVAFSVVATVIVGLALLTFATKFSCLQCRSYVGVIGSDKETENKGFIEF